MDIEQILQNIADKNEIKYHIVENDDLDDFCYSHGKFPKRDFIANNKTHFFATFKNDIIGFAILADKSKSLMMPLDNVFSLTNIEIREDFRNKGIASKLIDLTLEKTKEENKILHRTLPDPLGEKYIYDQISKKCESKKIEYIPHNLSFIYSMLEKDTFKFNPQFDNETKICYMFDLASETLKHPICKKYNAVDLKDLNLNFLEAAEETLNPKKNNKKTKINP